MKSPSNYTLFKVGLQPLLIQSDSKIKEGFRAYADLLLKIALGATIQLRMPRANRPCVRLATQLTTVYRHPVEEYYVHKLR